MHYLHGTKITMSAVKIFVYMSHKMHYGSNYIFFSVIMMLFTLKGVTVEDP